MAKLLLSAALAGILAAGAPAFAQDNGHHDDHHGGGQPQGGHQAGPPAGAQPMRGPGGPGPQHGGPQQNGQRMGGPQPQPGGMAGPNRGTFNQGGQVRQGAQGRRDFSQYHRDFNAPRRFQAPAYRQPSGWYAHRWTFGQILPAQFWVRDYWLNDYYDFGLMQPPPGTVWVRYGQDALLIDEYSGEVIQVEYGVFY
jgi:Ni/Co efflux regulator RcnB